VNLVNFVHSVVIGPKGRRIALTSVGFILFCAVVVVLVLGALQLDARLGINGAMPKGAGAIIGVPVLAIGVVTVSWCLVVFRFAGGTPVPFSPPPELVVRGPYSHTRNPMLTGFFASLVGLGLVLGSPSMLLGVVPVVVTAAYVELRLVEEPELRRRFGTQYVEYARRVPMFVPKPRDWGGTLFR
jgi:protein-S-isoprenylcysteine O-methyltransferase Ste14